MEGEIFFDCVSAGGERVWLLRLPSPSPKYPPNICIYGVDGGVLTYFCVPVLPPIPTVGLTAHDVDDLTKKVRDLMLKELVELSETPLGKKAISVTVNPAEEDLAELASAATQDRTLDKAGRRSGKKAVASGVDTTK